MASSRVISVETCALFLLPRPAFTFTFSTWLGNVELRISIVCEPAGISSVRSGGLTPRLLPSTRTSPQGSDREPTRASSALTGAALAPLGFASSPGAPPLLRLKLRLRRSFASAGGVTAVVAAWRGAGARRRRRGARSARAWAARAARRRADTPAKKSGGAATSADAARPSGALRRAAPPSARPAPSLGLGAARRATARRPDRVHLVLAHVLVGARALVAEQLHVVARTGTRRLRRRSATPGSGPARRSSSRVARR